ncbi:MAG: hypothetical protein ACLQGP_19435, partial [Isosphaeraceae bacterium]
CSLQSNTIKTTHMILQYILKKTPKKPGKTPCAGPGGELMSFWEAVSGQTYRWNQMKVETKDENLKQLRAYIERKVGELGEAARADFTRLSRLVYTSPLGGAPYESRVMDDASRPGISTFTHPRLS